HSAKMLLVLVLSLLASCTVAEEKGPPQDHHRAVFAYHPPAAPEDNALPRLTDVSAVKAFIDSAEVVVIGFFESDDSLGSKEFVAAAKEVKTIPAALCNEKEVWTDYSIESDTITLFRKADLHQESFVISKAKKVDTDGLVRFFTINDIRYITEYTQVSAVGLFQSKVKVHLVIFANRGSASYKSLTEELGALAPRYAGKMLFVLVNGKDRANERALGYFNLKPSDLPRVGLYDIESDKSWLLPAGKITNERVQDFCDSFVSGELQVGLLWWWVVGSYLAAMFAIPTCQTSPVIIRPMQLEYPHTVPADGAVGVEVE
ncbi:hypothetical protein NFI96_020546, partial [Prochilodus magdalenae]